MNLDWLALMLRVKDCLITLKTVRNQKAKPKKDNFKTE